MALAAAALVAAPSLSQRAPDDEPALVLRDNGQGAGYVYEPVELTVQAGAVVELRAEGGEPHTLTHQVADREFDVIVNVSQTRAWTAPAQTGDYPFFCKFHAGPDTPTGQGMTGMLHVVVFLGGGDGGDGTDGDGEDDGGSTQTSAAPLTLVLACVLLGAAAGWYARRR